MENGPPILDLDRVTVETGRSYDSGVWNVSLRMAAGELALVRLERSNPRLPIADAAQGLAETTAGSVAFGGEDWRSMSPARAAACRGRTGRVFDAHAWFHAIDLADNIMLAQTHHTGRAATEIAAEAAGLAAHFGLPGLPRARSWQAHPQDLQRAACARAFMGAPVLVLLEQPTRGLYPEIMAPLMSAIRRARARGAAVLWTTTDADVWNDRGIRPSLRFTMSGSQMLPVPQG
jgi:phospholipid/cholesterol/gamma-HCH transport system ATP-binding protein